jgi:hypothetical protein
LSAKQYEPQDAIGNQDKSQSNKCLQEPVEDQVQDTTGNPESVRKDGLHDPKAAELVGTIRASDAMGKEALLLNTLSI